MLNCRYHLTLPTLCADDMVVNSTANLIAGKNSAREDGGRTSHLRTYERRPVAYRGDRDLVIRTGSEFLS